MDKLLTFQECCTVMKCSYSKAQKLAKGKLPPFQNIIKLGSTYAMPMFELYKELGLALPINEED